MRRCRPQGRDKAAGYSCPGSPGPSLPREHTLTLDAELRVCLAPEFLRLAVRRPQIRDVAMSVSTAQRVTRMRKELQTRFLSCCLHRLSEITKPYEEEE